MESRNSFIISRGFRNYFIFSILFVISEQFCTIVDMMCVGNFAGVDAFSAVSLAIPIENIATGVFMLLTGGAGILASRMIGNQDFKKAYKTLTISASSSVIGAAILTVLAYVFFDNITSIVCQDSALSSYFREYLGIYLLSLVPMGLYNAVILILNIDGKPDVAVSVVAIACVIDILLDVVLMKNLGMGVAGQAMASMISYIVPLMILLPYIASKRCSFKFMWAGDYRWEGVGKNLTAGVPYCLPYIITSLITLFVNSLILSRLGTDALYIWGAGYQMMSTSIMIMSCIGGTILVTMGSMLTGCRDMEGLRILVRKCIMMTVVFVGSLVAVILTLPKLSMAVFGYDLSENDPATVLWIRCIVLFSIPYAVCCIKVYLFQALGRETASMIPILSLFALSLGFLFLAYKFKPEWMFYTLPTSGLLYIVLDIIISYAYHLRHPNLSAYLLIPDADKHKSKYMSVPYTHNGLDSALMELTVFLESCELPPKLTANVNLCCEELMLSIVDNNTDKRDEGYFFDVFVLCDDNDVKVTIKDAGDPFNPVRNYRMSAAGILKTGEDVDLSLNLVNVICQELTYNYMYGQNTIYMSFAK